MFKCIFSLKLRISHQQISQKTISRTSQKLSFVFQAKKKKNLPNVVILLHLIFKLSSLSICQKINEHQFQYLQLHGDLARQGNRTYSIFIKIMISLGNLWWIKEVKDAFTILSYCGGFGILRSLSWLLLQDLLCQAFTWIPLNLCPKKYPGINRL